jgi:hypothetical protein
VLGCKLDSVGSHLGSVAAYFKHGNEPLGPKISGEFLGHMSIFKLFKKFPLPWC